jgi:hypothetical protein
VVATTTILLAAASLTKMSAGAAAALTKMSAGAAEALTRMSAGAAGASNAAARVPALVKAKTLEVSAAATAFEQDSEVVAMLATEVSATEKGHETGSATSEMS